MEVIKYTIKESVFPGAAINIDGRICSPFEPLFGICINRVIEYPINFNIGQFSLPEKGLYQDYPFSYVGQKCDVLVSGVISTKNFPANQKIEEGSLAYVQPDGKFGVEPSGSHIGLWLCRPNKAGSAILHLRGNS